MRIDTTAGGMRTAGLYAGPVPERATLLGMVYRDGLMDCGALVGFEATGIMCQLNAGALRHLPRREVQALWAVAREQGRKQEEVEG